MSEETKDLGVEEYKDIVDHQIAELENYISEDNGLIKQGMMDAMAVVLTNLLKVHISKADKPTEIVENQINSTVGYIAGQCSEAFYVRNQKTLFGLPAPEATADEQTS